MKPKLFIIIFALVLVFMDTSQAQIRRRPGPPRRQNIPAQYRQQEMLGLFGGYNTDTEQYLIGAHFWLPAGVFWSLVPGFNYQLPGNGSDMDRWQFNGDLVFKPRPKGVFYFGGGVAMDYLSPDQGASDTRFGGSALTGLLFGGKRSPIKIFVQGRWTFMDDTEFGVTTGVNLVLR